MGSGFHQFGRSVLQSVWPNVIGGAPSIRELQTVAAISCGEGGYGKFTYKLLNIEPLPNDAYGSVISTESNSNNWGAVQCCKPPCPEGSSFKATDSNPDRHTSENPKGYYDICFKKHDSPEEGCSSYLKTLLTGHRSIVLDAVRVGSAHGIASAMRKTGYFQGFGSTQEERIQHYADGIMANAKKVATAFSEPLQISMNGSGNQSTNLPGDSGGAGGILLLTAAVGSYFLLKRGSR